MKRLFLIATALLLTAQSPSPKASPSGVNNYYYSGNWYYGSTLASPNPPPSERKTREPTQQKGTTKTTVAGDENTPPSNAAATVNQVPTATATPPSEGDGNQRGSESSTNGWLAIFTGALVLVGILQFCTLRQQAKIFGDSLIETRRAADAAKAGAEAAKISADTASASYYTAYRPWVLVSSFWIEEQAGRKLLLYTVYNVGPLPATLRAQHRAAHAAVLVPDDPEFAAAPTEGLVLRPNGSEEKGGLTFIYELPVSQPEWVQIESGKKTLFFFGKITYEGPLRLPSGDPILGITEFAASHKGALVVFGDGSESIKTFMQPLTDPKHSYVK